MDAARQVENAAEQNLGRSLSGNVIRGIIAFRDPEGLIKDGKVTPDKPDEDFKGIAKINEKLLEAAEKIMKKGSATMSFDEVAKIVEADTGVEGQKYFPIPVQYNPSSIRLYTSVGKQYGRSGTGMDTEQTTFDAPPSTTLSCELLFDDTNIQDAFMLDSNPVTNLSFGNVYSAIKSASKGKYSVKAQIDIFLALFALPQAKQVIFFYGNMSFRGEIVGADARYTMFNKKGNPIRGTIALEIRQGSKDSSKPQQGKQNFGGYNEAAAYWNRAFDRCFGEAGVNSEAGGRSNGGNALINLKL